METANELLRCFVKAVACFVRTHPVRESFDPAKVDYQPSPWTPLKKWLKASGAKLGLPQLCDDVDWTSV
jgi:hypothetical protein